MKLIDKISADMMTAYKEKNSEAKALLGLIKGESTKVNKSPEDDEVTSIIKSMVKNHEKTLEAYETATLSDVELTILNSYLPSLMSEEDLRSEIELIINTEGITGMQGMGKVMKDLKSNHDGQYDGKLASKIVKDLLS